jgi:hypothetical protein
MTNDDIIVFKSFLKLIQLYIIKTSMYPKDVVYIIEYEIIGLANLEFELQPLVYLHPIKSH